MIYFISQPMTGSAATERNNIAQNFSMEYGYIYLLQNNDSDK